MKTKKLAAGILIGVILAASTVSCGEQTETKEVPPVNARNGILSQAGALTVLTPQSTGNAVYYPNPDGGVTAMTQQKGAWESDKVLNDAFVLHMDVLGDELICGIAEGETLAWYVYDTGTDTKAPLPIPETGAAAEALSDASGVCIIGDGLYVMHSYWQGVSRIDLTTWECVSFDSETWDRQVSCAADETSFYVMKPFGPEVFDLSSGEKAVYDWSGSDAWLGSASIRSSYLTENGRLYLHIAREDAAVPDEMKRGILYADTADLAADPVPLANLGVLPAYAVTGMYGEYDGTLVLTDGDMLYAYDTETDRIADLCALPQTDVICSGAYVLTPTSDGYYVIAEIPGELS
ncbi:MAG: hypothetical protein IJW77_08510 [Clostridia bacterium]|nr:hypothetical protein [Clostridia bacterium]